MGKSRDTSDPPPSSPDGNPGLREAFVSAERVFWCNTNRDANPPNGNVLEQRMLAKRFAAAWTWGGLSAQDGMFNYPEHMQRVQCGDVIVMYANGVGVIAIGRATEGQVAVLGMHDPDRMRDYAMEGLNAEEWRIPVEWLVWDEANPCQVDWLRPSFQEITDLAGRVLAIRQHFGA